MLTLKTGAMSEERLEKKLFYYCNCVVDFYEDLKTIEESMARSQKEIGRRSKHSRIRKRGTIKIPALEIIVEETFDELNVEVQGMRDLAQIHRERALSCGALVLKQNEGRHFRLKKYLNLQQRSNST